jgi:lipopolysaccharide transport system permease protein
MSYVNIQDRRLPFALRYLGDLMAYRHLCWNLVASDMRARFRRTKLGILWAVIQPLAMALLIALVWGALARAKNYWEFAYYVFIGHVAFDLFTAALSEGQDAISKARGFVMQGRIPFFIFQLRIMLTAAVMFVFGLIGAICFAFATNQAPVLGLQSLLIPAFLGVALLFCMPVTIIMSLIGSQYRDVAHISQLVSRAIFMLSPIMLPREIIAETPHLQWMEIVNPIVPFLDMIRDPMMYGKFWDPQDVVVLSAWTTGLWILALFTAASAGRKVVFSI